MITGELKSKIDRIWDAIWAGGIANPLTVIEQLTYDTIANGDPHAVIEALGRLAGVVNIIIAAMAGYRGPILESPYADRRVTVEDGRCGSEV